jgi:hypothetical protein
MVALRLAPHAFLFLLVAFVPVTRAGNPLGDCSTEGGLASRGDVVFCEPWETPHWWQNGYVNHPRLENPVPATEEDVALTSIESAGCVAGRCVKVRMKQFESGSLSLHWLLKNAGLRPERLYMRYYLKLGPTFHNENCRLVDGRIVVEDQGGKFPGLADPRTSDDPGGQCGNGSQTADGLRCWTHRTGFRDCGQTAREPRVCRTVEGAATRYHGYIYFFGQQPYTGNPAYWDRDPWNQFTGRGGRCATEPTNLYCGVGANHGILVRERWYALEHFIGMNAPGQANGVIRGWVDGQLAYEKTNMIFRIPGHDNLHVRTAWLNVYKGGIYGSCVDSEVWLDQMVLATDAPIGLLQIDGGKPIPPRR